MIVRELVTLQLRYLHMPTEIAGEKNGTIRLPAAGRYDRGVYERDDGAKRQSRFAIWPATDLAQRLTRVPR